MKNHLKSLSKKNYPVLGLMVIGALFSLLAIVTPTYAQGPTAVQTLTGETGPGNCSIR